MYREAIYSEINQDAEPKKEGRKELKSIKLETKEEKVAEEPSLPENPQTPSEVHFNSQSLLSNFIETEKEEVRSKRGKTHAKAGRIFETTIEEDFKK